MKTIKFVALGAIATLMAACGGVADRHDEVKELIKDHTWDEEQTNRAIDIYLQGVDEYCDLYEAMYLIEEKTHIRLYAADIEDVMKERKSDLKEAERNLKKARKALDKKFSNKDYDDNDYDEYDEYDD